MVYKSSEAPHSGVRRLSLFIILLIAITSFVTIILGIAYARILYVAPRDPSLKNIPIDSDSYQPTAWYIFLYPFVPVMSLLHSMVEFWSLHNRIWNKPWQCAVRSFIIWLYFGAWITILIYWWTCDFGFYGPQTTVEYPSTKGAQFDYNEQSFTGHNYGLTIAKISFGHIINFLYWIYIPISAFTVQKALRLKKLAEQGRRERFLEDIELDIVVDGSVPMPRTMSDQAPIPVQNTGRQGSY